MQKLLQEHVNEDLDLISNHMMESRFYKYYAFLKNRSTVFDYAPDAQIILSSVEEVQDLSLIHIYSSSMWCREPCAQPEERINGGWKI